MQKRPQCLPALGEQRAAQRLGQRDEFASRAVVVKPAPPCLP
ncbi:hypothetical protein [Allofranklinella schreckenbergeri]|nr:hypothetical protein [Allofranklinella schreckenbergeri]